MCEPFTAQWRQAILAEPYTDIEQWRDQLESENKQLRMGVGIAQEIQRKLSLRSFMGGYKVELKEKGDATVNEQTGQLRPQADPHAGLGVGGHQRQHHALGMQFPQHFRNAGE